MTLLKKLAANKQTLFVMATTAVFSPAARGICYCLFKTGKLGNKKFKIIIQSIGFVLFTLYFRTLKDTVAYILLFEMVISYMIYQYYMLGLERKTE